MSIPKLRLEEVFFHDPSLRVRWDVNYPCGCDRMLPQGELRVERSNKGDDGVQGSRIIDPVYSRFGWALSLLCA